MDQSIPLSSPSSRLQPWFWTWTLLALISLFPVTNLLEGSFPIFTVLWLVVPLLAVLRGRDPARVGIRPVPPAALVKVALLNLGLLLLILLPLEAWVHTYRTLLEEVFAASRPDTTFGWLSRFPGLPGWLGMVLFSGLVTLFAEELCFRGWLLQWLSQRMKPWAAITLQAALFTLPQAIAALLLPPLQGILYVLFYSWLAIGVVGGWAAWRTGSIWPSLIAATFCNLILTILVM
jgi:ABC-2 type transport system permease protein/sodium transport system permease protein